MSHLYNPWKPEDDAFGRLRTSNPYTLGDYKHLYAIDPDFVDVKVGTGATITFDVNQAAAILQSGVSTNGYTIHQTKRYHHYMPGKSQLIFVRHNKMFIRELDTLMTEMAFSLSKHQMEF